MIFSGNVYSSELILGEFVSKSKQILATVNMAYDSVRTIKSTDESCGGSFWLWTWRWSSNINLLSFSYVKFSGWFIIVFSLSSLHICFDVVKQFLCFTHTRHKLFCVSASRESFYRYIKSNDFRWGAFRPNTRKNGLIWHVPGIGDTLWAYSAGRRNSSQRSWYFSQ